MSEEIKIRHELLKLREPFKENQISKLPKGTKAQNECPAQEKINCTVCGGWHHPRIIHLDYVGHAALTDRLLDVDPFWNWEPVAVDAGGYPLIDKDGGMWIKLTVCNVTRLGYGDSQGKTGANATKERIGDALRNAAMRFGAALDLWHKGDLHVEDEENHKEVTKTVTAGSAKATTTVVKEAPAGFSPHSDERNEAGEGWGVFAPSAKDGDIPDFITPAQVKILTRKAEALKVDLVAHLKHPIEQLDNVLYEDVKKWLETQGGKK